LKTDDLIELLAQDAPVRFRLGRALTIALCIGVVVSAAVLLSTIGVRHNISQALQTVRVEFKIIVTFALALAASNLVFKIAKPGVDIRSAMRNLLIPLGLLVVGVAAELFVLPTGRWTAAAAGRYSAFCLFFVPLLSLPPFIGFMLALKSGAPENSGFAGSVAGLAASGIGAAIYAWHCPDDSPLFVAVWYLAAIAGVTALGYFLGRRWLAW